MRQQNLRVAPMASFDEDAWIEQQAEKMRQQNLSVASSKLIETALLGAHAAGSMRPEELGEHQERAEKRSCTMFEHSPELAAYGGASKLKRSAASSKLIEPALLGAHAAGSMRPEELGEHKWRAEKRSCTMFEHSRHDTDSEACEAIEAGVEHAMHADASCGRPRAHGVHNLHRHVLACIRAHPHYPPELAAYGGASKLKRSAVHRTALPHALHTGGSLIAEIRVLQGPPGINSQKYSK
jgi:hypothetical protein